MLLKMKQIIKLLVNDMLMDMVNTELILIHNSLNTQTKHYQREDGVLT